jgi:hypothetical protein
MAYALVGSAGAFQNNVASGSTVPLGHTATAGNLLVLFYGGGNSINLAPTGYTKAVFQKDASGVTTEIWWKIAAGGETGISVGTVGAATFWAVLCEFSGNASSSPVDKTGTGQTTTSPVTVNASGTDVAAAELLCSADMIWLSKAGTDTTSDSYNSGLATPINLGNNDSTSIVNHPRFAYAILSGNAQLNSNQAFSSSMNLTGILGCIASFKLASAGPGPKAITPAQISATSTMSGAVRKTAAVRPTTNILATATVSGAGYRVLTPIAPTTNILATSSMSGAVTKLTGAVKQITPTPGPTILDNFNRADAGNLGANWTQVPSISSGRLSISGNKAVSAVFGSIAADIWTAAGFGADQSVKAKIAVTDNTDTGAKLLLMLNVAYPSGVFQGYVLEVWFASTGTSLFLYRVDNVETHTTLADLTAGYPIAAVNDTWELRRTGSTFSVYKNGTLVASPFDSITDPSPLSNSSGYIGAGIGSDTTPILGIDDFGTGGSPSGIVATSVVSGAIGRIRRITSAQISATSTMSGNTRATRRITPAQISASSTVSGSVRATRRIFPASIAATSAVTGVLSSLRRVAPTTIAAASTVSGAVSKSGGVKQLLPGAISANSTVSGSVGVRRVLAPASVAATASVSGTVRILRAVLPGQVSATSTVAGSIRVTRRVIPAQVAATSTVSGVLTKIGATRLISGTLSATSTVTGQVSTIHKVAGAVAATSTVSGSLSRIVRLAAGTINAPAIVSGSVRVTRAVLPAQILATASVTGAVRTLRKIAPATISATSAVSGNVFKLGQKPIIGANVQAISTISGSIRVTRRITTAQIAATSSVAGSVTKRARVAGTIQATATVSGSVRTLRGVLPALIQAASTVTGSTRVTRRIAGAVAATSTVSGSILRSGRITGTIAATSTVAGTIRPLRGIFPATILATSTVNGKVVRRVPIVPSLISSTSTLSGRVVVLRRIIPGLINSTSTLSGKIVVLRAIIPASISSTAIIFGAVGARRGIVGNILATSTVAGLVKISGIARIQSSTVFATSVVFGSVFRYTPTVTFSHAGTGTIFDRVATGAALVGSGEVMAGKTGVIS